MGSQIHPPTVKVFPLVGGKTWTLILDLDETLVVALMAHLLGKHLKKLQEWAHKHPKVHFDFEDHFRVNTGR